jgi:glucokinase
MALIGVDVGGGGVRAALVEGVEVGTIVREPLRARAVDDVVAAVEVVVRRLGAPTALVGVGVPGFVAGGVVRASPNFPGWRDVPLVGLLGARLGLPVHLENDANAAAFGAWSRLASGGDLVQLTLGTGVGGGVVTDGRLLRGAGGTGAELGHIYVGGSRPCGCGGVGCLETWASTVGLQAAATERGQQVPDGQTVVHAARAGEPWAVEVVEEAAEALGRGLTTLVNVFNPDLLRLSGGLAAARDLLAPRAEGWLRQRGVAASVERLRVVWADRADEDAILGAALAARQAQASRTAGA